MYSMSVSFNQTLHCIEKRFIATKFLRNQPSLKLLSRLSTPKTDWWEASPGSTIGGQLILNDSHCGSKYCHYSADDSRRSRIYKFSQATQRCTKLWNCIVHSFRLCSILGPQNHGIRMPIWFQVFKFFSDVIWSHESLAHFAISFCFRFSVTNYLFLSRIDSILTAVIYERFVNSEIQKLVFWRVSVHNEYHLENESVWSEIFIQKSYLCAQRFKRFHNWSCSISRKNLHQRKEYGSDRLWIHGF